MISASKLVERMNTCDERILRRTEDEVERSLFAAADNKQGYMRYKFLVDDSKIKSLVLKKLAASGYRVVEYPDHVYIIWDQTIETVWCA